MRYIASDIGEHNDLKLDSINEAFQKRVRAGASSTSILQILLARRHHTHQFSNNFSIFPFSFKSFITMPQQGISCIVETCQRQALSDSRTAEGWLLDNRSKMTTPQTCLVSPPSVNSLRHQCI
jgi:hypothetical protein